MTIREGKHRPAFTLPRIIKSHGNEIRYDVTFNSSCRYVIGEENQPDINKLFGIGYLPWHRKNSVRIGWNYNFVSDVINIWAYWYEDGKRHTEFIRTVNINQTYRMVILMPRVAKCHIIKINDHWHTVPMKQRKFGYALGLYFGGDMTAPHDIHVGMVKK
jgi:hypothetical protein